jgi:hypothetical protein
MDDKKDFKMSLRLTTSRGKLLETLSHRLGVPKTNVISMALGELAKKEGIPIPTEEKGSVAA